MTILELVQMAIEESGAKIDLPTTVVSQTGLSKKFVNWVVRAWKKIQMERLTYFWRIVSDQQLSLVASTNEYSLPAALESLNLRSLTCHLSDENETPVLFRPSDVYRSQVKRISMAEGKPQYFTVLPNRQLAFWPTPDQNYTINYEGIRAIETLDNTNDSSTPQYLSEDYHEAIVWVAVMSYAMHFEDGSKMAEAQAEYRPYKKYFEERFADIPVLDTTALYANYMYLG